MGVVKNTNDGTKREPYLRTDINIANVKGLPEYSSAPRGDDRAVYQAVKAMGYKGIQGGDVALCREVGLGVTGSGRVDAPEDAATVAREAKARGYECVTLHAGWGMDDDDVVCRQVEAILDASQRYDIPMYVETHRATITQDIWRAVKLAARFPEIRFNGDFSHWYNGLEMVYGGFEKKIDFLAPVLERVRFFHGRIASPGSIQVDVGDGEGRTYVAHFRELWTRGMMGFLRSAQPGDYICFAPELLGPDIYYARLVPNAQGEWVEESDRWQQAQVLTRIALECWDEAKRRLQ
jgi:hypothetical protein